MTSARNLLVNALTPLLPDFRVVGYADLPDAVSKPTLCCWVDRVERRSDVTASTVAVSYEAWMIVGTERLSVAEDRLDDLFEDVFRALRAVSFVEFQSAERAVLDSKYHGYRFTVTADHITI